MCNVLKRVQFIIDIEMIKRFIITSVWYREVPLVMCAFVTWLVLKTFICLRYFEVKLTGPSINYFNGQFILLIHTVIHGSPLNFR